MRLHHEEAAVEPRGEQVDQILLDAGKIGILPAMFDEVLAHGHERTGATRREV